MELGNTLRQIGLLLQQPLVALLRITGQQHRFALLIANKGLGQHVAIQSGELRIVRGGL